MNTATGLWASFRGKARNIDRQPPFDPLSYPVYGLAALAVLVETVIIQISDFTLPPNVYLSLFYVTLLLALVGLIARSYGMVRIAIALEAIALPTIIGALTAVATILLSAVAMSFVDDRLAAADRFLGFDWLAFYRFNLDHGWLIEISRYAYKSIAWQAPLAPLMLSLIAGRRRFWQFMCAWAIASILTVAIYPFAPAAGPYIYFDIPRGTLPIEHFSVASIIDGLRSGQLREIDEAMIGLVSLPSFHAASAILFAWAAWHVRMARPLMIPVNVLMLLSTVLIGDHYLVDLPAGIAVAALSLWLGGRIISRNAEVSAPDPGPGTNSSGYSAIDLSPMHEGQAL